MQSAEARQYELQDEEISVAIVQLADGEEEEHQPHRGSVHGRATVDRDRYTGRLRLMQDYFVDPPVYDERFFQRRYVSIGHRNC